jgi:hypothetical protein
MIANITLKNSLIIKSLIFNNYSKIVRYDTQLGIVFIFIFILMNLWQINDREHISTLFLSSTSIFTFKIDAMFRTLKS